jgi:hypothetical protein
MALLDIRRVAHSGAEVCQSLQWQYSTALDVPAGVVVIRDALLELATWPRPKHEIRWLRLDDNRQTPSNISVLARFGGVRSPSR